MNPLLLIGIVIMVGGIGVYIMLFRKGAYAAEEMLKADSAAAAKTQSDRRKIVLVLGGAMLLSAFLCLLGQVLHVDNLAIFCFIFTPCLAFPAVINGLAASFAKPTRSFGLLLLTITAISALLYIMALNV